MIWGYNYGWEGMLWMGLSMLFWFALLGLGIWLLVRWLGSRATPMKPQYPNAPTTLSSALEILRQRYARGEIDAATFKEMRAQLEETRVEDDRLQRV